MQKKKNEDIFNKYNNIKENNNNYEEIINELNENLNEYKNKYESLLKKDINA